MTTCVNYSQNIYDLFIPNIGIITSCKPFCISHDKTELFVITLCRIFIIIGILYILDSSINLSTHYIPYYLLLLLLIFNILYVPLIIIKKTEVYIDYSNLNS